MSHVCMCIVTTNECPMLCVYVCVTKQIAGASLEIAANQTAVTERVFLSMDVIEMYLTSACISCLVLTHRIPIAFI